MEAKHNRNRLDHHTEQEQHKQRKQPEKPSFRLNPRLVFIDSRNDPEVFFHDLLMELSEQG